MTNLQDHLKNIQTKTEIVPAEALLIKSCQGSRPPTGETMDHLWVMMTQLYGHRWVSSYGERVDPMGVWAASLKGITPEMIKRGLNKLISKGYEWPPSAPEFAKLCRLGPEDFDLPSLDDAIDSVTRFSHNKKARLSPFSYTLYTSVSKRLWDINRMPEREYRRELKAYYDKLVAHVVGGGTLTAQPGLIEEKKPEPKPVDPEYAAEKLAEIKSLFK